jgi:hypothetical protein
LRIVPLDLTSASGFATDGYDLLNCAHLLKDVEMLEGTDVWFWFYSEN